MYNDWYSIQRIWQLFYLWTQYYDKANGFLNPTEVFSSKYFKIMLRLSLVKHTCIVGSIRLKLLRMTLRGHISCNQSEESDVCEVRVSEPSRVAPSWSSMLVTMCWVQPRMYSTIWMSISAANCWAYCYSPWIRGLVELLDISYHPFYLWFLWAIFW